MAYLFANRDILRAPYRLAAEMKGGDAYEGSTTQDSCSEHLKRVHKKETALTPPLGAGTQAWGDAHRHVGYSGREMRVRRPGSVATFPAWLWT